MQAKSGDGSDHWQQLVITTANCNQGATQNLLLVIADPLTPIAATAPHAPGVTWSDKPKVATAEITSNNQ